MSFNTEAQLLSKNIASKILGCNNLEVIQTVQVGEIEYKNELILFIKPEIFLSEDLSKIENSINLVFRKLQEFNADVHGILILGGKILDDAEIMNRHYGFINKLSRSASKILSENDQEQIKKALNLTSLEDYKILGGHEYLEEFIDDNCSTLDELWFTKKSVKIKSGFYAQSYHKNSKNIILVNGFHPAQLEHYTNPSHRIVLMIIHSNTSWSVLRNKMVGATFPEKAEVDSIRGTLYTDSENFGLAEVNIANNGVHLSAGAFEGMFEIINFLGRVLNINPREEQPLIFKKMLACGIEIDQCLNASNNPLLVHEHGEVDLFSITEDKDTDEAISIYQSSLFNTKS